MTNAEKYKEEIRNTEFKLKCAVKSIRSGTSACRFDCERCEHESIKWLMQEYKEPPVDWNNVKPGTKIWVRNSDDKFWVVKEFAMYHGNRIWCFEDDPYTMRRWERGKLIGDDWYVQN